MYPIKLGVYIEYTNYIMKNIVVPTKVHLHQDRWINTIFPKEPGSWKTVDSSYILQE